MTQRWYNKASVQTALASGACLLLATVIGAVLMWFSPKDDHDHALLEHYENQVLSEIPSDLSEAVKLSEENLAGVGDAVRVLEREVAADRLSDSETYYRLGNYRFARNEYLRAVDLYRRALEIRPQWSKPAYAMALSFEELGDWTKALAAYQSADAQQSDPRALSRTLHNLGAMLFELEEYERAALQSERAAALSDLPTPDYRAAEAYRKLGDAQNELRSLKNFLSKSYKENAVTTAVRKRIEELNESLGETSNKPIQSHGAAHQR